MSAVESLARRHHEQRGFEEELGAAIERASSAPCPPTLARALHYAVFPGGARVRPRLTLAVAGACGMAHPELARAGAAAVELLHCASLVHDDLPMFDDADERRGRASVHRAFSEQTALLVGDALIVQSFDVLAQARGPAEVMAAMIRAVAAGVGAPRGIVAGQAWESEREVDLAEYHRAKTGALFVGAVVVGALAGGGEPMSWAPLGARLGEAYQIADDLADVLAPPDMGKPAGRDADLQRPSAVREFGVEGAQRRLAAALSAAEDSVPLCPHRGEFILALRSMIARRR